MIHPEKSSTNSWSENFYLTDNDMTFLYDWLHTHGEPSTLKDLTLAVIEQRIAQDVKAMQAELDKGEPYQPKKSFAIGETLVFPALGFVTGTVTGIRDGVNPTYPPFKVIQVKLEGENRTREFPSELESAHKLNADLLGAVRGESPKDIYKQHKAVLEPAVESRLEELSELGFVQVDGRWFVRELMAPVHIGHLNIAEALIELNNRAASTDEILKELDLPPEIGEGVRRFSVEAALRADERFIDLGTPQHPSWFLRRLVPPEALEKPVRLRYTPVPFDRAAINPVLQQIEAEIDDEASDLAAHKPAKREPGDHETIVLTYPHRRSGTLPLTPRTRGFFPASDAKIVPVRLVDGRTGEAMTGWMVPDGGYVFGLGEWYAKNELPAGAYISLQRAADPAETIVDFQSRRMRREWVRVAHADGDELTFQMTKYPISCEYDETMLLAEDNPEEVDGLWAAEEERNRPALGVLLDIFPELAKLNPRVHAKTLYAAFNVLRRCPPGPIFHQLSVHPSFEDVGNGYWTFDVTKAEKP